jgi:hypothetical protein
VPFHEAFVQGALCALADVKLGPAEADDNGPARKAVATTEVIIILLIVPFMVSSVATLAQPSKTWIQASSQKISPGHPLSCFVLQAEPVDSAAQLST